MLLSLFVKIANVTLQETSSADVASLGKVRKARIFIGDSTFRKVDTVVNRGEDITVYHRVKIEHVSDKAGQVFHGCRICAVLVHVGTNNAEKEGTYRILVKTHMNGLDTLCCRGYYQ